VTDALRAAIAADPDAIENWLVYADWLAERDDPRGELIVLELAIEARTAGDEAIHRHRALLRDEDALLSPQLADHAHHLDLELWRGFIRGARVFGPPDDLPTRAVLDALYADPHACLLRSLELGPHVELCTTPGGDRIRTLSLATLAPCELALDAGFPNLESLELTLGRDGLGDLDPASAPTRIEHARLREMRVDGSYPALRTGNFSLPALTTLSIAEDPLELFAAAGILATPPPGLSTLECLLLPGVPRALCGSPLVRQLRALACVVNEPLPDDDVRDLAALRGIEVTLVGCVETSEQRDALRSRVAVVLPEATFEVSSLDSYEPERELAPPPAVIDPDLAKTIAQGMQRLADRMRDRKR
jgi:uncharacterized protein (TIGR02996 family)